MKKDIRTAKMINRLLAGVITLAAGILLIVLRRGFLTTTFYLAAAVVVLGSGARLVAVLLQKPRVKRRIASALLGGVIGIVMFCLPVLPRFLIPELFAMYLLLNACVKTVDTVIIIREKTEHLLPVLLPCITYWAFGLILLFSPFYYLSAVLVVIGIYCILLGSTYIADFVRSSIPDRTKNRAKRHIRISLPIFLAAFVPHTVLTKLNSYLTITDSEPEVFRGLADKKEEAEPDLEIFIHVSCDGFCVIGHCDICFEGELIAYGNYDEASSTPIGTGDGVLLIADRASYIPYCLENNGTTLFSFGLRLSEEQRAAVHAAVSEIKERLVAWDPPFQAARRKDSAADAKAYPDFASRLCNETGARFYKFKRGRFKRYFVMSTNCVLLVDSIIGGAGTDILSLNGMVSPGTLYDYLESDFLKRDSIVISRNVYHVKDIARYRLAEKTDVEG